MSSGAFQVGPETFVLVRTQAFDAEGESAGEAELMGFVAGMGQVLAKIENALDGHRAGDTVEVTVAARDAYGLRRTDRILEVERSDFPEDVSEGDRYEVENMEGEMMVFHVLEVQSDYVVVDTNHPLAGQDVRFSMKIEEVRPASVDEIEAAEAALHEALDAPDADIPHVSAASLIRGAAPR